MKESNAFIFTLALLLIVFDGSKQCFAQITDETADHSQWTVLLKKHVRANGLVDYKGFISDQKDLNEYIRYLSNNPPVDSWSDADQIAYWINAYNAFTIKLIADNYPVESIKDLNPRLSIPTVRSIWTKEWFQMGGEDFSLDRIEHKILRKNFQEPRIHFAVNCASISCPVLRAEAYEGETLEEQLTEQTKLFLADNTRNKIKAQSVLVSKIFSWFGGDFKKKQSLIDFLNKYSPRQIEENARIRFMSYNWDLNDID